MKKFKIHFTGKRLAHWNYLQIHLLAWYLVPMQANALGKKRRGSPNPKHCGFEIYTPDRGAKSISDCKLTNVNHTYRSDRCYRWLCFTIHFTVLKPIGEIRSIYGKRYESDSETFAGAIDKYSRLVKTEYFN